MATVDKNEIIVDGKSEMIITNSKKAILIELLFFIFWSAIGIALIVFGSIQIGWSSLGFGIPMIIIGIFIVIIFFESFLSKLTCRILLNQDGIKTRVFIKWLSLSWSEIDAIEIDKRATTILKSNWSPRITQMKFFSKDEERITYPLIRFAKDDAENTVVLIKDYFKANRGIDLKEKTVTFSGKAELEPVSNSDENNSLKLETDIESQIPPRVEDYEIDDDKTKSST